MAFVSGDVGCPAGEPPEPVVPPPVSESAAIEVIGAAIAAANETAISESLSTRVLFIREPPSPALQEAARPSILEAERNVAIVRRRSLVGTAKGIVPAVDLSRGNGALALPLLPFVD
jgi:hypothetical protein